jgi:hypothetical protein
MNRSLATPPMSPVIVVMKFGSVLSLIILVSVSASVAAQQPVPVPNEAPNNEPPNQEPKAVPEVASEVAGSDVPKVAKKKSRLAFSDNFSGAKSFQVTNTNGASTESGASGSRLLFPFVSESVGGKLSVTAMSDNKTIGPDGKPGVLAFTIAALPKTAQFCGLVYMGRESRRVRLPGFNVPSEELLRRTRITFRYRADNTCEGEVGGVWRFRFEPNLEDSYSGRLDFGEIEATEQWKTFEATLADGENRDAFLNVAGESPENVFKFVWGQKGDVTSYSEGDTLLIDDVAITVSR